MLSETKQSKTSKKRVFLKLSIFSSIENGYHVGYVSIPLILLISLLFWTRLHWKFRKKKKICLLKEEWVIHVCCLIALYTHLQKISKTWKLDCHWECWYWSLASFLTPSGTSTFPVVAIHFENPTPSRVHLNEILTLICFQENSSLPPNPCKTTAAME